jgi:hypothetical protein
MLAYTGVVLRPGKALGLCKTMALAGVFFLLVYLLPTCMKKPCRGFAREACTEPHVDLMALRVSMVCSRASSCRQQQAADLMA